MNETKNYAPKHPPQYREEIAQPVFDRIATGESCTIIGASSMGKTRFVNSIMQPATQEYYLGEESAHILIFHVDFNQIDEIEDWAAFELILNTILNSELKPSVTERDRDYIDSLHRFTALKKDPLIASRYVERAVNILIKHKNLKLCFIFDDFDSCYQNLPAKTLNKLRALRDSYKNRLCYVLLMRHRLSDLRDPLEVEHFHELVTIFRYGLQPYTMEDAKDMIQNLEKRRGKIQTEFKKQILRISGGHPGLINNLFNIASDEPQYFNLKDYFSSINELLEHTKVKRECTSLFESLSEKEQIGYRNFIKENTVAPEIFEMLVLRGIINTDKKHRIPIFYKFVQSMD